MREILFKAKRIGNGEWAEGSLIVYPDGDSYICGDCDEPYTLNKYKVDPETVCQYTGLTDSKGNKIFEGDIIRYADKVDVDCYVESIENPEDYDGYDYSDIFTVDKVIYGLENDYPAFDLSEHQFDCNALSELKNGEWYFDVISNIFDNPELLEVSE